MISHLRASRDRVRFRVGPRLSTAIMAAAILTAACDATGPTEVVPGDPGDARTSLIAAAEDLVLVGFESPPGTAEVAAVEALGGEVIHQYEYIPVLAVRIPDSAREELEAEPGVVYVEDDLAIEPHQATERGKQIADWGVRRIEAPAAWDLGTRGEGSKVGILDSGIDLDHPDLVVAGGIDLVGDGNGLDDCQGHGTHVAGIVAAKDNGNHTVGVAPRTELYSMRFADCTWSGATLAKMIQAIEWAIDNEIDVVNMSFGFVLPGGVASSPVPPDIPSNAARDAFAEAFARGVVLVGSSGNSSTPYVGFPAAYESVIAVGATDDEDNLAVFSQYGTEQELTAPGVNNLSSFLVGQGQSTSLTVVSDDDRELEAVAMEFAGMTGKKGVTAEAVYAGFGTAAEFAGVNCTDRVAVISRGGGTFAQKAEAAMDAGCVAAVVHNHTPGNFNGTLGEPTASDGREWIPVVSVSLEDGLYLKDQIETGTTVVTLINSDGNLAVLSGTSMASPHAVGVAALVRSRNPSLSSDEVRAILRNSVDDLGTPGFDPVFGHGRVNARRAVEQTP